jgi:hypothetical protein
VVEDLKGFDDIPDRQSGFFLYFGYFYIILRNEAGQKIFFKNLTLLSHVRPCGTTYEGVTPCALAQL